ncbi:hypothetical protein M1466_00845 [Candidatus Dependentiae bacterium]|nr:hypothetical protein [Candidatus Dependentiae bacterium]
MNKLLIGIAFLSVGISGSTLAVTVMVNSKIAGAVRVRFTENWTEKKSRGTSVTVITKQGQEGRSTILLKPATYQCEIERVQAGKLITIATPGILDLHGVPEDMMVSLCIEPTVNLAADENIGFLPALVTWQKSPLANAPVAAE